MTEANVVYKAIADFAELRREIKGLRSDIRELEAEEAAYNKLQAKPSGPDKHSTSAKSISEETRTLDLAVRSYRSYTSATLESAKATREANTETDKYGRTIKDVVRATNDSTEASDKRSKASKENIKSALEEISTLRNLESRFKEGKEAQDRLRASQEAAGASARRWARDVHDASDEAASASKRAADAIVRDAARSARAQAQNRDSQGRFAPTVPTIDPIVGNSGRTFNRDAQGRFTGNGSGGGNNSGSGDDGASRNITKILDAANKAGGAVLGLFGAILKLSAIASIIGPGIAALVAMGAAALGAAGALSEVAGSLLVLPGLVGTAIVGIGTLILAFRGISEVFKAYSAQQKDLAANAVASSRAQRDATEQISDAERALQRAKEDAARSRVDAAERVTDAERALHEAQQDQARDEVDAAERITDADHDLERAQLHLIRAQDDLTQARKDALQSLIDLRKEVEHGTLNEESAVAALARAQAAYNKVLAEPGSTAADKLSALSNLHEAQQKITDVQDKNKKSQEELTKASLKGVEGSDRVVNAKETLIDSEKNLREATEETQRAREDQARSELDYADRLVDAQKELKRAREDEARVAVDSLEAISDAETALVKATEALEDAQTKNSASAKAFQAALDKLSPSAQKVVLGLIAMKDAFTEIKKSVQEAFFAPLVGQLDGVKKSLPDIRDNLTKVAAALGDVAAAFFEWLTSPEMRPFFKALTDSTATIIRTVGPALIDIFKGLAVVIKVSLPFIERMANSFAKAARSFSDFLETARGQNRVNGILEQGFKRANEFWNIIKNLASAFGSLLSAARPFNDWIINGLTKGTESFKEWAKAQELDGSPFKTYLENIKPLLQEIGHLLKAFTDYIFHQAADPKNISKAIDLFRQLRTELGPAVAKLLEVLRDKNVFSSFVSTLTSIINALTTFIEKGGGQGFLAVVAAFGAIGKAFKFIVDHTPTAVISTISTLLAGLAVLKFTGVLALLRGLASGALVAALPEVAAGLAAVAVAALAINKFKDLSKDKVDTEHPDTTEAGTAVKKNGFETVRQPGHFAAGPVKPGEKRAFIPDQVRPIGPVVPGQEGATVAAPEVIERSSLGKKVDDIKKSVADTWDTIKKFGADLKKLFGPDLEKVWNTLKEKAGPAFSKIAGDIRDVFNAAKPLLAILGSAFLLVLKVLSKVFSETLGPAIDFFVDQMHAFLQILRGVLDFVSGVFTGDWSLAWKGIKEIFGGIWDEIINVFKNVPKVLFSIVKGIVEGVVEFFKWLWDVLLGHSIIPDIINGIINWFLSLPGKLLGIVGDIVKGIFNLWKDVFKGLAKLLETAFEPIKDTFKNLFNGVLKFAEGFWEKITDIFKRPVEFLINTVLDKGLIQGVNFILGALHLPELPRIHLKFAEGGRVPGEGDQDSVPAMLTPGEVVLKKKTVEKLGIQKALYLNEHGELPGYARGGEVKRQKFAVGGLPNPINIVKGAAKAVSHGIIEGIEFVGNLTRDVSAKMLEVVFNRVRGLIGKIPGGNILGVPVGMANKLFTGILNVVRGGNNDSAKPTPQNQRTSSLQGKQYAAGGLVSPNLYHMFNAGGLAQPPTWRMPDQQQVPNRPASSVSRSVSPGGEETTINRGFHVENLNINNPKSEPASDSLPNSIRKMVYLSGGPR